MVEPFDECSFGIHVGKTERPVYFGHAFWFCPLFDGIEKRFADFFVVDEIDKSEASCFFPGLFIRFVVDDSGNSADGFPVFIGHVVNRFAEVERRIVFRIQGSYFVQNQSRYIVFVSFV